MTLLQAKYRAHTNIALIKYWGKRDHQLFLPMTSSLSLTLDAFFTDTHIQFDSDLSHDVFVLNGETQDRRATDKITRFVNLFRSQANMDQTFLLVHWQ